jgi:hypothetical protein
MITRNRKKGFLGSTARPARQADNLTPRRHLNTEIFSDLVQITSIYLFCAFGDNSFLKRTDALLEMTNLIIT